jgi:hypothetical protein
MGLWGLPVEDNFRLFEISTRIYREGLVVSVWFFRRCPAIDVKNSGEAVGWGGVRVTVALSAKVVNSRQAKGHVGKA